MNPMIIFRRTLLLLMALMGSITASAYDYDFLVENDQGVSIPYKIMDSETMTVEVTYHQSRGIYSENRYDDIDLVIPSTVKWNDKTYTVTGIGDYAFCYSHIKSILLPNTIESIEDCAFLFCNNLSSLTIPENVTSIGAGVIGKYGGAESPLENIKKLYYNAKHADGAESSYSHVGSFNLGSDCEVIIGENVEHIPNYFLKKSKISSVHIPSSVTSIGEYAFSGCTGLTSITLPSNINSIGEGAFNYCTGINIVIACMTTPPAIVSSTFSFRTQATLYVPAGSFSLYAAADYWKEFGTIVENAAIVFEDPQVENICVSNWDDNGDGKLDRIEATYVTDLGTAFQGNAQITSFRELQYFTGLTSISDNAFSDCTNLQWVYLLNNVTAIGDNAFKNCSSLSTITLTENIATIGSSAFAGCSGLVSIPNLDKVTTIGESAFAGCTGMTEISFNATAVESNTFQGCTNLNSVTLGSKVADIKEGAFSNCTSLTTINIPGTVITIRGGFEGCTSLSNVTLNTGTKYIVNGVFTGCSSLTSITLPNGLVDIGESVFEGTGICTIDIPSSVTSIGSRAFSDCSNLKQVTVNWLDPLIVSADAFPNRANQILIIPEDTHVAYKAANVWKDFNLIAEPGDVLDFPYAIYNATAHSLTFYNDGQALSKSGMLIYMPEGTATPEWQDYRADITTVTFDESFTTFQPTTTARWFNGFNELTTINGLTNLNTSQVTTMQAMFQSCFKLTQCDVSGFNTANVTNMSSMFSYCRLLPSIDVSGFNTVKVTTMYAMFQGCNVVTTLDLSSFNTANVTDMRYMFDECRALKTIMAGSGWTTAAVTSSDDMFASCTKLVGGLGTTYNANARDKEWARVDGGYGTPGYLTDKGSPYAVLSTDGKTLTFYADGKRLQHTEQTYSLNDSSSDPDWCTYPSSITTVVFDASMASARPTNTNCWFASMDKLTTITGMEYLNTSEVTDMNQMFYDCEKLTSLDLSHFNTSKVTNMEGMFNDCSSLTSLDLSSFNTSNVDIMNDMFNGCSSLVNLNLSSFNTSKVTHMSGMFAECSSLVELNLNSFNTSNVRYMNYLFYNCSSLTTVSVGDGWDASRASTDDMFFHCYSIVGELGTTYTAYGENVGEDAAHIDTEDYPGYFVSADYLTVPYALLSADKKTLTLYHDGQRGTRRTQKTYSLDWPDGDEPYWFSDDSHYDITHVVFDASFADVRPTNTYYWFGEMENLLTITGLEYLNTSEVTNMYGMFMDCCSLTSLDVSHFDTKKVTTMRGLFAGCSEVPSLDVSHFDTRNVTNMADMFSSCSSLTALDIRNFDTQKVTDMYAMFWDCQELTSLDVRFLNTANVTDMSGMFGECQKLESLDLTGFNTAKVTNMSNMFSDCNALTSLDLTSFNTANVTNMGRMFCNSSALRTIVVGDGWSTGLVTQSNYMFTGCTSLVGGAGTVFASNHVDAEYAHLDGGLDNPGYLSKYDVGLTVGGVTVNLTNMADILGDGTVSYDPATLTLMLNNASIVMESGHAIETTAGYSGSQLIIELLGQNYIDSGDDYEPDIVLSTNTFIKGPGELTLEDNSSSRIRLTDSYNLFITYGCTIRARFISTTGSDPGNLFVTGADTRIILSAGDETEANIYGFNDVLLDEDSGLQFTYPAGAWYDNMDEFCVMCDYGEAYGVTIECPPYYAVYDSGTTTLTFYGDGQRASHNGETEKVYFLNQGSVNPYWYADGNYANVTTVVFDPSFADVRPTSTYGWFYEMEDLTRIDGMENLNTRDVTDMSNMFSDCMSLTSLDLSHFDTGKVTNMCGMFKACGQLKSLDLSSFATRQVTDMSSMFFNCYSLKTVYVKEDYYYWETSNVESSENMFLGCISIVGGGGTTYDANNIGKAYAHIDGGTANPGYFTAKPAFLLGDVNGDGQITIADVTALVNIILGKDTTGQYNHAAADVNQDNQITIADVTALVNIILGKN